VVANQVDLSVNKGCSPGDPPPGGEYVYIVKVNNNAPTAALNVRVTDTLPASVAVLSTWEPSGWSVDRSQPGKVVWRAATMNGWSGQHMELRLHVPGNVPLDTQLSNLVEIGNSIPDTDLNNNSNRHDACVKQPRVNLVTQKWYDGGQPVVQYEGLR
jgi:uncharacterized repeat protein (TIGR01451 family)